MNFNIKKKSFYFPWKNILGGSVEYCQHRFGVSLLGSFHRFKMRGVGFKMTQGF